MIQAEYNYIVICFFKKHINTDQNNRMFIRDRQLITNLQTKIKSGFSAKTMYSFKRRSFPK